MKKKSTSIKITKEPRRGITNLDLVIEKIGTAKGLTQEEKQKALDELSVLRRAGKLVIHSTDMTVPGGELWSLSQWSQSPSGIEFWLKVKASIQ